MQLRIHLGKLVPILAIPLLVGAGAGSALAADPSWSLKAAADRAGDALPIGASPAVTTSVSGAGSTARKVQQLSAHFSTDRAGDATPIGALWRVDHQQGQMAERAGDKTVN